MTEAANGEGRRPAAIRTGARTLAENLDSLVASTVSGEGERRVQAVSIGLLILLSGLAAMASPLPVLGGAGIGSILVPILLSSALLASAVTLCLTGAFDIVAWSIGSLGCACLAFVPAPSLGLDSHALVLLAALACEAAIAGRPKLAAGFALSLGAMVAAAFLRAGEPAGFAMEAGPLLIAGLALWMGSLAFRAGRRFRRTGSAHGVAARPAAVEDLAEPLSLALIELGDDGRILSASRHAIALFGQGGEEAPIAGPFVDRVHVADRVAFLKAVDLFGTEGGEARETDVEPTVRLRQGDGTFRVVRLHLSRAAGPAGGLWLRMEPARTQSGDDAAIALRAALETATQSSAAKSQFLATVSHELRTPLNAIIGFSDILDQEIFGSFESDRQKEYVGLIRQSGQHLLSVVNGLLDVSKIEAGRYELHPEPFVFADALTRAADIVRDQAKAKKLRLDVRKACGDQLIVADRRACHQILLNLLSNAVKFTDVGVVTLESRLAGDFLEIAVSDTGIGIAPADLDRLGKPFTQVAAPPRADRPGTGLGLSLVKGLAELHGGSMSIRSQPSIGTMVTIRLPTDCTREDVLAPACRPSPSTENIIALNDARTKQAESPSLLTPRRSA